MMDFLGTLIFLALIYLFGYSLLRFRKREESFELFETLGYSFGLGIGIIVFLLILYSLLGIEWNRLNIVFPPLLFSLVLFAKKHKGLVSKSKIMFSQKESCSVFLIVLTAFYLLIQTLIRPVSAWDAWANWFFGGKAFYLSKTIDPHIYKFANFENPPATQLLLAYDYIVTGNQNDTASLLLFYFFYINLLLLFFSRLKDTTNVLNALVFTSILATLPAVMRQAGRFDIGFIDLPLSFFFLCVILLYSRLKDFKHVLDLFFIEFLLGMGVLVKNEGVFFLFIMQAFILLKIFKKGVLTPKIILSYCVGFLPFLYWTLFKNIYDINSANYLLHGAFQISRFSIIGRSFFLEFLNIQRWNIIWIYFFVLLFYTLLRKKFKNISFLLPVSLQLLFYIFVYFVTPTGYEQIHGTIDRFLLQLLPIIVFWMGTESYEYIKGEKFFKNEKK